MGGIVLSTTKKIEIVDITEKVSELVRKAGLKEGVCSVFVPHATAAIMINESEPRLEKDFEEVFARLVAGGAYGHNEIDDNAEAHMLSGIVGCERSVPIVAGRLALGTWQRIMLCEFDGPHAGRRVFVSVIGK